MVGPSGLLGGELFLTKGLLCPAPVGISRENLSKVSDGRVFWGGSGWRIEG